MLLCSKVPMSSSLVAQSRKVVSLGEEDEYCWVSDHRMLFIRKRMLPNRHFIPEYRYKASLFDIRQGKQWRLRGLTHTLNRAGWPSSDFMPSPDGRWLFWITRKTGDQWPFRATARIYGSGYYDQWSTEKSSWCRWVDSQHWLDVQQHTDVTKRDNPAQIFLHDVLHPSLTQEYSPFSRKGKALLRSRLGKPVAFFAVAGKLTGTANRYTVKEYDPNWNAAPESMVPSRAFKVTLPCKCDVEVLASPRGGRRLYILTSPLQHADGTYPEHQTTSLWTSYQRGIHLRLLGYEPKYQTGFDDIVGEEWSPDGRYVSFIYKHRVYLLNVTCYATRETKAHPLPRIPQNVAPAKS